jgi:hypothetical protein
VKAIHPCFGIANTLLRYSKSTSVQAQVTSRLARALLCRPARLGDFQSIHLPVESGYGSWSPIG